MLAASFASAGAGTNVYLYDPSVASDIDLQTYLESGDVLQPDGQGFPRHVDRTPAPPEYGTIAIAERGMEQLGLSGTQIDGVIFVNHGDHLKAHKKALVLWIIKIPNASQRMASEFASDLTLSLWVDWNQDTVWRESERMITRSVNLADKLPTTWNDIVVFYLTSFDCPDVTMSMESNKKYGNSGKDVRYMWARATLSCDDPDNSPDGAQLFGDYEDYRIAYLVEPDDKQHHDDDGHGHGH